MATEALAGLGHLVVCGTQAPVAFFAYPGRPSRLADPETEVDVLAGPREDVAGALEALADALGASAEAPVADAARPELPAGALDAAAIGAAVAALLPEGAIVVDESVTASAPIVQATAGAAPHDWLTLTGGAIGQGLPVATGAAVACPGRPVLSLEGDGSAMYTIQSLWTQARESLDVTTVILANRSYAILDFELSRVGARGARPRRRGAVRDRPAGPRLRRAGAEHGRAGAPRGGRGDLHGRAARGPGRARAAADRGADLGGVRRERQHRQAADDRAAEQPDHRAVAPQAALGADVGAAAGAGDGVGARAAAAGRAGGRGEAAEERAHAFSDRLRGRGLEPGAWCVADVNGSGWGSGWSGACRFPSSTPRAGIDWSGKRR